MDRKIYVGVSGFSYPRWKGKFYPEETKNEDFLAYYARQLGSVEINSSFYAPPRATMVKNWNDKTNEKFRFSFKAPKQITHVLKLGKASFESAERFSKTLDALGPRRGPILFQSPPYLKQDLSLLGDFLSGTSSVKDRVFEFRHDSWLQDSTYRLLDKQEAAFCVAETEDMNPVFKVTGGFAYFRLRKDSYDKKAIESWAGPIRETAKGQPSCYVYLRHDEVGENPLLARELFEKLQN